MSTGIIISLIAIPLLLIACMVALKFLKPSISYFDVKKGILYLIHEITDIPGKIFIVGITALLVIISMGITWVESNNLSVFMSVIYGNNMNTTSSTGFWLCFLIGILGTVCMAAGTKVWATRKNVDSSGGVEFSIVEKGLVAGSLFGVLFSYGTMMGIAYIGYIYWPIEILMPGGKMIDFDTRTIVENLIFLDGEYDTQLAVETVFTCKTRFWFMIPYIAAAIITDAMVALFALRDGAVEDIEARLADHNLNNEHEEEYYENDPADNTNSNDDTDDGRTTF